MSQDMTRSDQAPDVLREAEALQAVLQAIADLPTAAIRRIIDWVADAYEIRTGAVRSATASNAGTQLRGVQGGRHPTEAQSSEFADIATFYDAAKPSTDVLRALVVGYWLQVLERQESFTSQAVNGTLKDLGHGVSNITKAFRHLATHDPVWARQVKKSGTSRQARKLYRLTNEGVREVERMIKAEPTP
jgi:hypothetical protein